LRSSANSGHEADGLRDEQQGAAYEVDGVIIFIMFLFYYFNMYSKILDISKRRGIVYPSFEIYDDLLGNELDNIRVLKNIPK